jgi:lipopolysaccharide/colanic/teichoic acid biosynthesis glycosyltransferase
MVLSIATCVRSLEWLKMQKHSVTDGLAQTSRWMDISPGLLPRPRPAGTRQRWDRIEYQSGLPLYWSGEAPAPSQAEVAAWQAAAKRLFDLGLALLLLLLLAPLLMLVSLAIVATSPGSPLFVQEREGRYGRRFLALKFRTMRFDQCDTSGVAQTRGADPRITGVGRLLRRTSIDELPQLVNVVRGEMSLVGPRPHVPQMLAGGVRYRDLVPYYAMRLAVRPGLTGWAQANGLRGQTRDAGLAKARIDHDVAYIQNFSLWLDAAILLMTLRREFINGSGE